MFKTFIKSGGGIGPTMPSNQFLFFETKVLIPTDFLSDLTDKGRTMFDTALFLPKKRAFL